MFMDKRASQQSDSPSLREGREAVRAQVLEAVPLLVLVRPQNEALAEEQDLKIKTGVRC
jgi:hypothetical protein